jgi:uncharacterized membrane protein (UPF0127 family)
MKPQDQIPSEPTLRAVNISKGEMIVAKRVKWAGTSAERRRGLLGRNHLDDEEGIYIVPCKWIHMFGMKFPIDVAFLARDGRVLTVHHGLKPNRLSKISIRADGVLELAAGRLHATNTDVGDIIQFREAGPSATLTPE